MHLFASTDSVGSKCSVDMGVTTEEYYAMSETQKSELVAKWQSNVVDVWVQECDSE